jgi:hypothetical protein
VVRGLGNASKTDETQQHALKLAVIGLALTHGENRSEIHALLGLPLSIILRDYLVSCID